MNIKGGVDTTELSLENEYDDGEGLYEYFEGRNSGSVKDYKGLENGYVASEYSRVPVGAVSVSCSRWMTRRSTERHVVRGPSHHYSILLVPF